MTIPAVEDPTSTNLWGAMLNTGVIPVIDNAVAGVQTIPVVAGTPYIALTASQGIVDGTQAKIFLLTGVMDQPLTIFYPQGLCRNFTFNITGMNTGGFTITLAVSNGGSPPAPAGIAQNLVNLVNDYWSDGTNIFSKSYGAAQQWSFDVSSPPSSDIFLNPGDRLAITYENVTSIPLSVDCGNTASVYRIIWTYTSGNSYNSDIHFQPNNTTYASAFANYQIYGLDQNFTAFGSATSEASYVAISVAPYAGYIPIASVATPGNGGATSDFYIDLFGGPNPFDTINDFGPFVIEMLVTTWISYKAVVSHGGITGGAGINYNVWFDSNPWVSLGTLYINPLGGVPASPSNAFAMTGAVFVERIK